VGLHSERKTARRGGFLTNPGDHDQNKSSAQQKKGKGTISHRGFQPGKGSTVLLTMLSSGTKSDRGSGGVWVGGGVCGWGWGVCGGGTELTCI